MSATGNRTKASIGDLKNVLQLLVKVCERTLRNGNESWDDSANISGVDYLSRYFKKII